MHSQAGLSVVTGFSGWDVLLVLAVTAQATLLAYLGHPRWKALILTLPIPFSLATLSLGVSVGATNAVGLVLLFCYTLGVYLLHALRRVPILLGIAVCAVGYCVAGALLARILPRSEGAFWVAAGAVFLAGLLLYRLMPERQEPAHRSPLPVPVKAVMIAGVVVLLVVIKQHLQGFMTVFPMVGVIASYEGRHCLWTLARQVPVVMITMLPMMAAVHLLQPAVGIGWALAGGWLVFLVILAPVTRRQWMRAPLSE